MNRSPRGYINDVNEAARHLLQLLSIPHAEYRVGEFEVRQLVQDLGPAEAEASLDDAQPTSVEAFEVRTTLKDLRTVITRLVDF